MKRTLKLLALMLISQSIGPRTVKPKEQMKQDKVDISSSTKGDTEVLKQKQVNFLKKHESEITNYIKSNDPEVVRIQVWLG